MEDKIFEKETGEKLETARALARRSGKRLTFDCLKAIQEGDKILCKCHRLQTKRAYMPALSVYRGVSATYCQSCSDYDIDEEGITAYI